MKKYFSRFLFTFLGLFLVFLTSVTAIAAVIGELNSGKSTSISSSKYDLDGDKKVDKITIKCIKDEDDYSGYTLSVGKKVATEKDIWFYNAKIEIVDLNKKDKYQEVAISMKSDNDYQFMHVYRWDGKNLKLLGELPGGRINREDVSFPGNGTVITYERMDILGTFDCQTRYKMDEKKLKFVLVNEKTHLALDKQHATVIKSFKVYSALNGKTPNVTLIKGEKLTRTGTDGKNWVSCLTSKGKTIWIKAAAEDPNGDYPNYSLIDGYGSMYDYLEGFDFYGQNILTVMAKTHKSTRHPFGCPVLTLFAS